MSQPQITEKVIEGLASGAFITTAGMAKWVGCNRGQVVDACDEIEAAGVKLMRIRGIGGGAQYLGKRMRRAA